MYNGHIITGSSTNVLNLTTFPVYTGGSKSHEQRVLKSTIEESHLAPKTPQAEMPDKIGNYYDPVHPDDCKAWWSPSL